MLRSIVVAAASVAARQVFAEVAVSLRVAVVEAFVVAEVSTFFTYKQMSQVAVAVAATCPSGKATVASLPVTAETSSTTVEAVVSVRAVVVEEATGKNSTSNKFSNKLLSQRPWRIPWRTWWL